MPARPSSGLRLDVLHVAQLYEQRAQSLVLDHLQGAVRAVHSLALQHLEQPSLPPAGPSRQGPAPAHRAVRTLGKAVQLLHWFAGKLQSQTLNNLAQSYARLGDRKRAQQYLDQALALDVAGEELAATHLAFSSLLGGWGEKKEGLRHAG